MKVVSFTTDYFSESKYGQSEYWLSRFSTEKEDFSRYDSDEYDTIGDLLKLKNHDSKNISHQ